MARQVVSTLNTGTVAASGSVTGIGVYDGADRVYSAGNPPPAGSAFGPAAYRQIGTGATTVGANARRYQAAGHPMAQNSAGGQSPGQYIVFFLPFFNGLAGTLVDARINISTNGATGSFARIGLYAQAAGTQPYPGALILDGGTQLIDTTGTKTFSMSSTTLAANTLYWVAVAYSGSAAAIRALSSGMPIVNGWDAAFASAGSGWGWQIPNSGTNLGGTYVTNGFPSTVPTDTTNGAIPATGNAILVLLNIT